MIKAETVNRQGKIDTQAKTREAKLGCIFTQTGMDKEMEGPNVMKIQQHIPRSNRAAEEFGKRIYGEARRRGIESAKRFV